MFTRKSWRQPTELELSGVTGLLLPMRSYGHFQGLRRTRFALISSAGAVLMRPRTILRRWDYFKRVGHGQYEVLPKYRTAGLSIGSSAARPREVGANSQREKPGHPSLRDVIHAVVQPDEDGYFVECLEVAVVTQGDTLDELMQNLDEALSLHLEGEDLAALGLSSHPKLQLIIEKPLTL